ncbi:MULTISPECIES: hypothetical protein [unclassified Campylobacter]|nr:MULTISPECIES: hypothetical protein [unclassified Campylobacter]
MIFNSYECLNMLPKYSFKVAYLSFYFFIKEIALNFPMKEFKKE